MDVKPLIGLSYELAFQLANTLVIFLVLKKLLFKPVLNIIEEREREVQDSIAQGEKAINEGESFKREYEEKMNSAKDEAQEIIKNATVRAEQRSEEIISTAKEDAKQIIEKANKDIALEKKKVMNEIKDDISSLALLAASKVIEDEIDEAKHQKLINNFIKEVAK